MASTHGPITPTDEQIHERATRVVYHALGIIEKMVDGSEAMNYEKMGVLASAVQAGTEAMLPPDKADDEYDG